MADAYGTHQLNGGALKVASLPPGVSGTPYVISSQEGETIYIPFSRSVTKLLVTGVESDNAFAVVGSVGSQGDPIGFHYHRQAHDVFLCLNGNVNIWINDQCRTLGPGDFASVPPNAIHQFQILGNHSEMIGLIVPGGWEEFFRAIGDPYDGPLWPIDDQRNVFEVLIPRLKAAAEQFDMVPCPQHKGAGPSQWREDENNLPGTLEPYFLKNGTGPAYLAGGSLIRPLVTTAESDGKFSIASIEGSNFQQDGDVFPEGRRLAFSEIHHAFQVTGGVVEIHLDLSATLLHAGEVVYVPKGTGFSYHVRSRYAKLYAFASGGGIVDLLCKLGEQCDLPTPPEHVNKLQLESIKSAVIGSGAVLT